MKRNLKDKLKGGLDELLQPTVQAKHNSCEAIAQQKKKSSIKRCNFLIESEYHTQLKIIAAQNNVSMIDALKEALDMYFTQYNKKDNPQII